MRGRTLTIGVLGISLLGVAACAAEEPVTTQQAARATAASTTAEPDSPGKPASPAAEVTTREVTSGPTGQPVPDMASKLVREMPESFIGVGDDNTFLVRAEGLEKAKRIVDGRYPIRVDGRLSYGQAARYQQLLEEQANETIGGRNVVTFVSWRDYGVTMWVYRGRWTPERRDALQAMAVKLAAQLAKEFNLSDESAQAMEKSAEGAHITPQVATGEKMLGNKD